MSVGVEDFYDLVDDDLIDPLDWGEELLRYKVAMILSPSQWSTLANEGPLEWQEVRFARENQSAVPDDSGGVYSFVVKPGIASHPGCSYLFYVGKAEDQSLRQRFLQYFDKANRKGRKELSKQPRVRRMLLRWPEHLWFYYVRVEDSKQIAPLEERLIHAFVPWVNDLVYPAELRAAIKAYP